MATDVAATAAERIFSMNIAFNTSLIKTTTLAALAPVPISELVRKASAALAVERSNDIGTWWASDPPAGIMIIGHADGATPCFIKRERSHSLARNRRVAIVPIGQPRCRAA
jgi:hypothetical protein